MYCSNCGTLLDKGSVFCGGCGTKADQGGVQTTANNSPSVQRPTYTPPPQTIVVREKSSNPLGAIMVILLLLGAGVFFFGDELGITQECAIPLCSNNSQLFGDLCTNHRRDVDRVNNAIDGIRGFFR